MPEPLTIPFSVPGIRTAAKDAAELANNFNRAGKEAGKFATGPFQRLQSLQAQSARASGASGAVRQDLAYLISNAQRRVDRIQQGPQQSGVIQKVMAAVTSSRFSLGGGGASAMPLVGRTLEALGLGEAAGPIGLAIGAIVSAGMALHALAESAAETARNFAAIRDTTGTSGAQAGQLQLLGGAGGINDIASLARSLHERITTDPLAMGQAQGMGVNAVGGPFGTLNAGQELIQTVKGLRNLRGDDRLYAARLTGAEQLLPLTRLSDKTLNKMGADAALTGQIQSPEAAMQGQELQAAEARLSNAKDNLMSALGRPIVNDLIDIFNLMADGVNAAAKWVDEHKAVIDVIHKAIRNLVAYEIGGIPGLMKSLQMDADRPASSGSGSTDSRGTAIDMNTQAIGQNTTALRQLHGKIGGGDYAAGALPSALGGMQLRRAYDMHALNLSTL